MTLGDGGLETEVETEKRCPLSAQLYRHRPPAPRARGLDPGTQVQIGGPLVAFFAADSAPQNVVVGDAR